MLAPAFGNRQELKNVFEELAGVTDVGLNVQEDPQLR